MEDEKCVEISFYDEADVFGGTIKKHPQKRYIIETVSLLPHLKKLDLRKCKLGQLPKMSSRTLNFLDLSSNDLDTFPDWIIGQPLTYLNLGANSLRSVPDLYSLPLEVLKLHKNPIDVMPRVGNAIKSLNLFLTKLPCFPNSVLDMLNLEVFTFGVTDMDYLPSLAGLQNLRWLTLTLSEIDTLPDDICSLSRLEGLQLAKNKLIQLPDRIGDLQNLRAMTLYSNKISELPVSFYELKLKKLNLACNPLLDKSKLLETYKNIDFLRL
jgi:Leucine-rich repeat (LRR) protein